MCYEKHRLVCLSPYRKHIVVELFSCELVKCRERFVHQQYVGLYRKRSCYAYSLLHTARKLSGVLVKLAEYKPLAKIEELEEQNYNMIDERLNNGVEKFNREEEKKEQQEKPQARSSLKERLAAKQKEATQGNNKDTKEQEKSKNSHREM